MTMMQSIISNDTKSSGSKIDCAKECPCGVPVIPVPDQWLEVMVTGGFKVWHIIFIIIAFIVTMTVVYCCFHRCRIPRTKQEIEADLMRTNLANKFSYHLQELPNEPTTFIEALKKVQELEEKLEQDDAAFSRELGARKRMGWLKLKGKDKQQDDKENNKTTGGDGETVAEQPINNNANDAIPNGDTGVTNQTSIEHTSQIPNGIATNNEDAKNIPMPIDDKKSNKNSETNDSVTAKTPSGKRRRHKPGLSRTKASGRLDTTIPLGGDEPQSPPFQVINIEENHNKQTDEKKIVDQEHEEKVPKTIKAHKHKSPRNESPIKNELHVRIDTRSKQLVENSVTVGE